MTHGILGKKVLDVGSSGSILPGIVAGLGNKVTCIDVREWPVQVKNLEFKKCDLLDCDIPKGSFDAVTCVSTVEHIGLGRYGDMEDPDGDIKGVALLMEHLKPGGMLILTAPFGKAGIAYPAHRIYDRGRFDRLVAGYEPVEVRFHAPVDQQNVYRPCTEEETLKIDTAKTMGNVCALLRKKG